MINMDGNVYTWKLKDITIRVVLCIVFQTPSPFIFDQVTEFMFQNATAQGVASEPLPLASGLDTSGRHVPQPATLFSNGHVRAEVAVQVGV